MLEYIGSSDIRVDDSSNNFYNNHGFVGKNTKWPTANFVGDGGRKSRSSMSVTSSSQSLTPNEFGAVVTQIVVAETDVVHSGVYKCEPGAAPEAKVNVHVLDGKHFFFFFFLLLTKKIVLFAF